MHKFLSWLFPIIETIHVPIESISSSLYANESDREFISDSASFGVLSSMFSENSAANDKPSPLNVLLNTNGI